MENQQLTLYIGKYGDMVYRVAYNYLKNHADSEDIVQDAFIKLYRSNESFDGEQHVKAWLIRVAANLAKNHLKSPAQSRRAELDENTSEAEAEDKGLSEAMERLPSKYGIVMYLHYFEGYEVREIAKMLRITESNVKIRLKRGREKLKGFLEEN